MVERVEQLHPKLQVVVFPRGEVLDGCEIHDLEPGAPQAVPARRSQRAGRRSEGRSVDPVVGALVRGYRIRPGHDVRVQGGSPEVGGKGAPGL
jgi:hypothetical protein